MHFKAFVRPFLVSPHLPRIPRHIGGEGRGRCPRGRSRPARRALPAWQRYLRHLRYANGNAVRPAARAFIDFLAHDFGDTPL